MAINTRGARIAIQLLGCASVSVIAASAAMAQTTAKQATVDAAVQAANTSNDEEIVVFEAIDDDVVDEAAPCLAVPRNVSVRAQQGHVEVLLPVGVAGHGALRLRVRCGAARWQAVVPIVVAADGDATAVLARH